MFPLLDDPAGGGNQPAARGSLQPLRGRSGRDRGSSGMTGKWSARDIGLAVAAAALILDQATKLLMLYGVGLFYFRPGEHISLLPFFNLVMVWNPGISYGLFPAHGPPQITLLIVVT